MKVRFWGTRGSVPTPGPRTARFGGNTSCVELHADDGTRLVIDCGTGARELGAHLLAQNVNPLAVHLLISHTHWDHIQGFPFFGPAYVPGCAIDVYSPPGLEGTLEASLSGQMQYTYFPVRLGDLRARIAFHELGEGGFHAGGAYVQAQYLNHTAPALGYRITIGGVTVVYATDHEPFWWPLVRGRGIWNPTHPGDSRHVAFLEGADIVIHDSQYVDLEYPTKRGWGHSTVEYVTEVAALAGVRQLVLFHHDPTHDDRLVASITRAASRRVLTQGSAMEVVAAAEGLEIELPERAAAFPIAAKPQTARVRAAPWGAKILVAGGDAGDLEGLRDALAPDGHRLIPVPPDNVVRAIEQYDPALIMLVAGTELPDPLRTAGDLREGSVGASVPIVAVVGEDEPNRAAELLDEATDVVTRPWSPPMLRSRVRAWLARSGAMEKQEAQSKKGRRKAPGRKHARLPDLFRGLPARERAALLGDAATCHFSAGEVLFNEGDPAGGVYLIREGAVQVGTRAPDGQEVALAVLEAGDTVGELAPLDAGPRTATARAILPTVADFVTRDAFLAGLAVSPQACLRLLRLLATRLRATDRRMGELAFGALPSRVARQLLQGMGRRNGASAVEMDSLADKVGVDRPRLERALMLLEAGGLVRAEGEHVVVVDPDGLLRFVFE
jgi:CRP-like cAMP-binding protein/phosphoribosyl 1,2-cyclic phosphodiesterase